MRTRGYLNIKEYRDPELAALYKEFAQYCESQDLYKKSLPDYLSHLNKKLSALMKEDISWSYLCQILSVRSKYCGIWSYFFEFLLKNSNYHGEYVEFLHEHVNLIARTLHTGASKSAFEKWGCAITPYSIISADSVSSSGAVITRVATIPNAGIGVNQIITGFINYVKTSYGGTNIASSVFSMIEIVFSDYSGEYESIQLFDDDSFYKHYSKIMSHYESRKGNVHKLRAAILGQLIGFYGYIQTLLSDEIRNANFKLFDSTVLKYQRLQGCLEQGYEVVNYNIYSEPPKGSKFLINPRQMHTRGAGEIDKPVAFDISSITNSRIRDWVLECYWKDTEHILSTRGKTYSPVIDFAVMVCRRYQPEDVDINITIDDILDYKKAVLSKANQASTESRCLGMIKYFLQFIESKGYAEIDGLHYRVLVHSDSKSSPNKAAYTNEEIHQLTEAYRSYAEQNKDSLFGVLYELHHIFFQILTVSDIRYSNLLELRKDSLQKTLNRNGADEYKVVIRAKNGQDDDVVYNITRYTKALITEAMKLTEDLRLEANGPEADYVFIYKRKAHNSIALFRDGTVRNFHIRICEMAGVRYLTLAGVRNMYGQAASNRIAKDGYDPVMVEKITGHTHSVHVRSYDKPDIYEFCQRFYQVEIGSVHISGSVEIKTDLPEAQTVMNGCGHCKEKNCILNGYLECLLCKSFVTTLDCIPYFEEAIKTLDEMIRKQHIAHEREFLISKKKLHVAYLEKLMELEAATNDENN